MSVFAFILAGLCLAFGNEFGSYIAADNASAQNFLLQITMLGDPTPAWIPSKWAANLLAGYLKATPQLNINSLGLLITTALGTLSLGYLVFEALLNRALTQSTQYRRGRRKLHSFRKFRLSRLLIPFQPQLRALFLKEARMILRDTAQALQFILLLLLTFIYLYNFRALGLLSSDATTGLDWWQVLLSTTNIILGSCIVSAICARFVFPSLSLEGSAYPIIRAAPLTALPITKAQIYSLATADNRTFFSASGIGKFGNVCPSQGGSDYLPAFYTNEHWSCWPGNWNGRCVYQL